MLWWIVLFDGYGEICGVYGGVGGFDESVGFGLSVVNLLRNLGGVCGCRDWFEVMCVFGIFEILGDCMDELCEIVFVMILIWGIVGLL